MFFKYSKEEFQYTPPSGGELPIIVLEQNISGFNTRLRVEANGGKKNATNRNEWFQYTPPSGGEQRSDKNHI